MSNGGFLAPPEQEPEREDLWNETWKRINRFRPNFFAELFPEEAKKPKSERKVKDDTTKGKAKENEKADTEQLPAVQAEDEAETK